MKEEPENLKKTALEQKIECDKNAFPHIQKHPCK